MGEKMKKNEQKTKLIAIITVITALAILSISALLMISAGCKGNALAKNQTENETSEADQLTGAAVENIDQENIQYDGNEILNENSDEPTANTITETEKTLEPTETIVITNKTKTTKAAEFEVVTIKTATNSIKINAEIAATETARERGLSFRPKDNLTDDTGMLFVYPKPTQVYYWMRNMNFPIDMVFIDESNRIVNVYKNVPACTADPCTKYPSVYTIAYALEVNAGFIDSNGVNINDEVVFGEE